MKRLLIVIAVVIFATLLLPLAIVWIIGGGNAGDKELKEQLDTGNVSVFVTDEGRIVDMDINKYLKCAVAAEMPADFEEEALKAQAVAARTYLYSKLSGSGSDDAKHMGATVCTDSTHCQAYISEEKRRESWGDVADEKWNRISTAVDATAGQIMTYKGEIISAVFHSTSSGNTEAAVDVWGNDVPYLQSVESPGDIESPKYNSEVIVSEDEFKNTVSEKIEGVDWSNGLISDIVRSDAGGIISLNVGGVTIRGTELRTLFSLRSTNTDIIQENGEVKMTVRGFGHGVGMSQYGANYMASQGKTCEEILKTYYTGVKIETR